MGAKHWNEAEALGRAQDDGLHGLELRVIEAEERWQFQALEHDDIKLTLFVVSNVELISKLHH